MKLFLILPLSLLLPRLCLAEVIYDVPPSPPRIDFEYKIILSTGIELALKKYDPEFQVLKAEDFNPLLRKIYPYKVLWFDRTITGYQTPPAVIGDFNGDAKPDAVLIGRNKTHGKRIAILSNGNEYTVIEFSAGPLLKEPTALDHERKVGNIEGCLELIPPGKIKAEPAFNRPEIDLKTDAFKYGGFEGSQGIYYYNEGKFIDYALSD
ncbi:MAG: hypothetical protein Q7R35_13490 [Elusimicrobiota bacterium]|nr:hypothetical protein [Elusimicrobiota bacterium]